MIRISVRCAERPRRPTDERPGVALPAKAWFSVKVPKPPPTREVRGNERADMLMIVQPPSEQEIVQGMPFIEPEANEFHNLLEEHYDGLSTNDDFLVVSCSLYGLKTTKGRKVPHPSKASTSPIADFVRECAKKKLFRRYVVIGDEAFKFALAEGKKPAMSTLVGTTMHMVELQYTPLFVFPDVRPLCPVFGDDKRENFFMRRLADETRDKIQNLALKFKKFAE